MIAPTSYKSSRTHHKSWRAKFESLIDRVGNPTIGLQVVEVVWLDASSITDVNADDSRFEFRFLTADEVRGYSVDSSLKLGPEFADRVEAGHDFCFAALEGDKVAAYGWYALDCIEAEHNFGVAMSYPADTAYMYKGYTHPDYRGLRLHGRAMGLALRALQPKGVVHLVSTVDWTNQASLKSCDRLGYHRLGRIVTLGPAQSLALRLPRQAVERGVRFGYQARQRSDAPHPLAITTEANAALSSDGLSCPVAKL